MLFKGFFDWTGQDATGSEQDGAVQHRTGQDKDRIRTEKHTTKQNKHNKSKQTRPDKNEQIIKQANRTSNQTRKTKQTQTLHHALPQSLAPGRGRGISRNAGGGRSSAGALVSYSAQMANDLCFVHDVGDAQVIEAI